MKNTLTERLPSRIRKLFRIERFYRDLIIIGLSMVIAALLVHIGVLEEVLAQFEEQEALASFVAGIFFTSVFTLAPASIVLAELSQQAPLHTVALLGGLGAMFGDAILFLFVRDIFGEDLHAFLKKHKDVRIISHLHFGFLRWLQPVIGALIIASPLPDELGITMLGLAKLKLRVLLPIAFLMNTLGIYLVGLVARGVMGG